jgi:hypothetical protein
MSNLNMEKLETLKLVADLAERESDRTWRRATTMMTVNAGLFVLISVAFQGNNRCLILVSSIFGIVLSIVWYFIASISKHYESRWHDNMEMIINSNKMLRDLVRARKKKKPKILGRNIWSATKLFKVVIVLTGIMWAVLLIVAILKKY